MILKKGMLVKHKGNFGYNDKDIYLVLTDPFKKYSTEPLAVEMFSFDENRIIWDYAAWCDSPYEVLSRKLRNKKK
jgi:hypothetical protein